VRVCLATVREKPFRWEETREVSTEALSQAELRDIGPVAWQGEIRYVQPDFLLTASIAYDQTLVCDRCLKSARDRVESDLQLLLVTGEDPVSEERELEAEDLGRVVVGDEDDEVDLDPILLEQMQLQVPMKPLCRPDCAGLCSQCGADLNQSPCSCATQEGDPRWAALEEIKSRLPNDE
jgi:uncharacterized protein